MKYIIVHILTFRLSVLQSMILPQSSAIYNNRCLFQYTKCKGNTVHNSCYINIYSSCTRRNRTGLGVLGLYTNTNTVHILVSKFFVKMSMYCATISEYLQTWRILVSVIQNTLRIQSIIYVQYSAHPLILYTVQVYIPYQSNHMYNLRLDRTYLCAEHYMFSRITSLHVYDHIYHLFALTISR